MKIHLFRKLLEKGYDKHQIARLMEFIKRYVRFDKKEFYTKFETDVQIITKNKSPMGIMEAVLYSAKQEGIEKGIEKGVERGVEKERIRSIKRVLEKGYSVEVVADMFDVEIEYIESINKIIASDNT